MSPIQHSARLIPPLASRSFVSSSPGPKTLAAPATIPTPRGMASRTTTAMMWCVGGAAGMWLESR